MAGSALSPEAPAWPGSAHSSPRLCHITEARGHGPAHRKALRQHGLWHVAPAQTQGTRGHGTQHPLHSGQWGLPLMGAASSACTELAWWVPLCPEGGLGIGVTELGLDGTSRDLVVAPGSACAAALSRPGLPALGTCLRPDASPTFNLRDWQGSQALLPLPKHPVVPAGPMPGSPLPQPELAFIKAGLDTARRVYL